VYVAANVFPGKKAKTTSIKTPIAVANFCCIIFENLLLKEMMDISLYFFVLFFFVFGF